jgi:hypothetical protein
MLGLVCDISGLEEYLVVVGDILLVLATPTRDGLAGFTGLW